MSFPSDNAIETESSSTGFDQIVIYAYAAIHASLPTGGDAHTVLSSFQGQMQSQAASFGISENLLEGYIQQYGTIPSTSNQIISWAHGENFLDSAGNVQQAVPPGHNYPPGGAATTPPPTDKTASTNPPDTSSAFGFLTNPVNIGGIQVSPIALGVAGVAALVLLPELLGGHRR